MSTAALTGLVCFMLLALPAVLFFAVKMGMRQGQRAKDEKDAAHERIALGGFTPTTPEPWLAGTAKDRPVRIKAASTVAYQSFGGAGPASLTLGHKIVAVFPLNVPAMGGVLNSSGSQSSDRSFRQRYVATPIDMPVPRGLQQVLLAHDAQKAPHQPVSIGDSQNKWMYAAGVFPDAPTVLRAESPPIDHLPTLHHWLHQMADLAAALEQAPQA